MTILPLLEVNYANAAITSSEELFTERIVYTGINGDMHAYVVRLGNLQANQYAPIVRTLVAVVKQADVPVGAH